MPNEFYKVTFHFMLNIKRIIMCFNIAVGSDANGKDLLCLISGDPLSVTSQESLMSLSEGVCLIL